VNSSKTIAESYGQARRIARLSSSNFYRSFWLLPAAKRRAMDALYAFARVTDDLGDHHAPPDQRAAWLLWWRKRTKQALAIADAEEGPTSPRPASPAADLSSAGALDAPVPPLPSDLARSADRLLPALADAADRFAIPPQHLLEIIDGVLADQRKTRFDTFEQLEHYCYLVATAVGLCCLTFGN